VFLQAINKSEVIEVLPDYRQDILPMNAIWDPTLVLLVQVRSFVDFMVE